MTTSQYNILLGQKRNPGFLNSVYRSVEKTTDLCTFYIWFLSVSVMTNIPLCQLKRLQHNTIIKYEERVQSIFQIGHYRLMGYIMKSAYMYV